MNIKQSLILKNLSILIIMIFSGKEAPGYSKNRQYASDEEGRFLLNIKIIGSKRN